MGRLWGRQAARLAPNGGGWGGGARRGEQRLKCRLLQLQLLHASSPCVHCAPCLRAVPSARRGVASAGVTPEANDQGPLPTDK